MSTASKLTVFQYTTKAEGINTTKRWQFDCDSAGLLEAIRILTPMYITRIINKALKQEAYNELRGKSTFSVKEDKDES